MYERGDGKKRPPKFGNGDDMPDFGILLNGKRGKHERDEEIDEDNLLESEEDRVFIRGTDKETDESPSFTENSMGSQPTPHQKHYTWVMETGRNTPTTSNTNIPILLGAHDPPQLPIHFQHLLAASSMLWNPFESRPLQYQIIPQPYYPVASKKCSNCGATSTPSWRRCPAGKNLLCNACGLYQKLHNKPRPFRVAEDGSIRVQRNCGQLEREVIEEGEKVCINCNTRETPLWRKVGRLLYCNACALFYKTHGLHRPVSATKRANDSLI